VVYAAADALGNLNTSDFLDAEPIPVVELDRFDVGRFVRAKDEEIEARDRLIEFGAEWAPWANRSVRPSTVAMRVGVPKRCALSELEAQLPDKPSRPRAIKGRKLGPDVKACVTCDGTVDVELNRDRCYACVTAPKKGPVRIVIATTKPKRVRSVSPPAPKVPKRFVGDPVPCSAGCGREVHTKGRACAICTRRSGLGLGPISEPGPYASFEISG
jgi:hypothetical protein